MAVRILYDWPGFDAPQLPLVDSSGNPLIGADGNPISYAAQVSKTIYSPMLGIGLHEYASKHVRLDVRNGVCGPAHWTIWQADATANIRVSHFEIGFGAKAFHFKTSPAQDFFVRGTMASPFVSLKWFSHKRRFAASGRMHSPGGGFHPWGGLVRRSGRSFTVAVP